MVRANFQLKSRVQRCRITTALKVTESLERLLIMPRQKRPKIITALAGWFIICSIVGALVFSVTIPRVDAIQADGEQARWVVDHLGRSGLLAITLIVYLCAGSTGVGLWRLRPWGRQAILLISAALVAVSLVVGSITAIRAHALDANAVILAIVFGWPLYYFNRPKIKNLFV